MGMRDLTCVTGFPHLSQSKSLIKYYSYQSESSWPILGTRESECHLKFPQWRGSPFPVYLPTNLCNLGKKPQVIALSFPFLSSLFLPLSFLPSFPPTLSWFGWASFMGTQVLLAPHLLSCSCTRLQTYPKIFLLPKRGKRKLCIFPPINN